MRLVSQDQNGTLIPRFETVPTRISTRKERIMAQLPNPIITTEDKGFTLQDVAIGKIDLDMFIAQLNDSELEELTIGYGPMNCPFGVPGNAGGFGGFSDSLKKKGVPVITTTDGPSGIRSAYQASLVPIGTMLACSWNTELVESLFQRVGQEMEQIGTDVLLGPGMNIHRSPLCGRNFEYFSEDPLVTGKIAAAVVRGIQKNGRSACPKHFACNNQEYKRDVHDARVSERALREIYLKGFELCVKESKPKNIMTSYNKINGVWSHYNDELVTTVLRNEWGYQGNVLTDWWMQPCVDPDFPLIADNAYRIRAQVDVLMPGGKAWNNSEIDRSLLFSLDRENGITRGEIQRSVKNVLQFMLNSPHFKKDTSNEK
jgi:beta-glucosidase